MKRKSRKRSEDFPTDIKQLESIIKNDFFKDTPDLSTKHFTVNGQPIIVLFINYMIDKNHLYEYILEPLQKKEEQWDLGSLNNEIPVESNQQRTTFQEVGDDLMKGHVAIYIEEMDACVTYPIPRLDKRSLEKAETESLVFGPQVSFTESLQSNLNILHWRLDTPELKVEKFIIGKTIPTEVRLVYLNDIASDENVSEMRKRLEKLAVDDVVESSTLTQMIEDNSYTIFPQFLATELPDRFCYSLKEGRIGVLVDKSPTGIIAPTTFFSYFQSTEDLYTRWSMGTFIRLMRMVAMFLSVILTPLYVAALTFHYEIIPSALLVSLGHSRSRVPFPPLLEALLLEVLIELIREAGARLPTKVGQTMGIVGGIVIGQAIVQAGFTSNILIIIVALSALASFTAPSYLMGSAIRIIRFPVIILAGFWGFIGIAFAIAFLIIHLLKISSLKRPYLSPLYPLQIKDIDNSLLRLPFLLSNKRARSNLPKKLKRFDRPKKS
ncbi:spore germination protein [Halalkalibacillus sediminis]|uniref:Spore germination protein n=1 Tax=Halalkalibacillus sediminis TaxID=2018042 RepID=A0A2I0QV97_9BACI|nr:spore germination protein [Halalkalibacillus sediminis]PKR78234.1 spore germination protein [Halalkalibacillus sediminis]